MSASKPKEYVPNEEDVEHLMFMGFKEIFAKAALIRTKGDVGEASLELCDNADARRKDPPPLIIAPSSEVMFQNFMSSGMGKKTNSFGVVMDEEMDNDENGENQNEEDGEYVGYDDDYQDDGNYYDYDEEMEPECDSQTGGPRYIPPELGGFKFFTPEQLASIRLESCLRNTYVGSNDLAEPLLMSNNWNVESVQSLYFDKKDQALATIGMANYDDSVIRARLENTARMGREHMCLICFENFDESTMFAMNCNHWFCKKDYSEFLKTAIDCNSVEFFCPAQCKTRIVSSVLENLCPPSHFQKYRKAILDNFVSNSKDMKFCPGVNCSLICVSNQADSIVCPSCHCRCCFNCCESDHIPAYCEQVKDWKAKSKEEGPSVLWIKDNTQSCPNCRSPIQKNEGCNHMTCRKEAKGCGFEFCWICLGDWKNHRACNKFDKPTGLKDDKRNIGRFTHFFHRYVAQQNSENFAINARTKFIERSGVSMESATDINNLTKAHDLIVRCRSVLKYSYVYGFFSYQIPEGDLQDSSSSSSSSSSAIANNSNVSSQAGTNSNSGGSAKSGGFMNSISSLFSSQSKSAAPAAPAPEPSKSTKGKKDTKKSISKGKPGTVVVDLMDDSSSSAAGGGSRSRSQSLDFLAPPGPRKPAVCQELFEMHQEMLETNSEILHGLLEKEPIFMQTILNQSTITENFLQRILEQLK